MKLTENHSAAPNPNQIPLTYINLMKQLKARRMEWNGYETRLQG
jgi:hypothetical protein